MVRVPVAPAALERYASENAEQLNRIAEDGRSKGAIHHHFLAGDGEVVVIDEWKSAEAFQGFFDAQEDIPQVMQAIGATGGPEVTFFEPIDTPDAY
jgi:heme-degrading monooxygenase HmoA